MVLLINTSQSVVVFLNYKLIDLYQELLIHIVLNLYNKKRFMIYIRQEQRYWGFHRNIVEETKIVKF